MSICWRSYFRAKQEQGDCNIPQLVERYLFQEGIPWALVGRAWGQLAQASPWSLPRQGSQQVLGEGHQQEANTVGACLLP